MTTQTTETAPSPAISEAAVEAAAASIWAEDALLDSIAVHGWYEELGPVKEVRWKYREVARAALLAAVPHLRVQAAPPPPDGLDAFAAWLDGAYPHRTEGWGPTQELVAEFRATRPAAASPAPAAPTETLDDALAKIEALGGRFDGFEPHWDDATIKRGWSATAFMAARGEKRWGESVVARGDTMIAAAIALRDAIAAAQQPQEGAEG